MVVVTDVALVVVTTLTPVVGPRPASNTGRVCQTKPAGCSTAKEERVPVSRDGQLHAKLVVVAVVVVLPAVVVLQLGSCDTRRTTHPPRFRLHTTQY